MSKVPLALSSCRLPACLTDVELGELPRRCRVPIPENRPMTSEERSSNLDQRQRRIAPKQSASSHIYSSTGQRMLGPNRTRYPDCIPNLEALWATFASVGHDR